MRIAVTVAAATLDDEADVARGGSVAYRVARGLWFEGELTWIDEGRRAAGDLAIPPPPDPPVQGHPGEGNLAGPIEPGSLAAERESTVLMGTLGMRYELPVETARFRPYVAGGLGLNHTEEALRLAASGTVLQDTVSTGYAFTAGTGVSVRVVNWIWADVDATYLRLSGGRQAMRLGGGLSVRF